MPVLQQHLLSTVVSSIFFPIQGCGHTCGIPTVLMMVLGSGVTTCNLEAFTDGFLPRLSGLEWQEAASAFHNFIACI